MIRIALILLIVATTTVRGDQPGAKEMFFDPQRSVSEAATGSVAPKITDEGGRRVAQVASDVATLGLSYWIELISDSGNGTHVTDERTFRSGDRIRLHFRGNADGRLVIVQLGSSGSSTVLFPDAGKGLSQNRIRANRDHVLPSGTHWFRFDRKSGTERLLVLFARNQEDLDRAFPTQQAMNADATAMLLSAVRQSTGGKDLFIESETREPSEIGSYAVNVAGKPIALEIALVHQ